MQWINFQVWVVTIPYLTEGHTHISSYDAHGNIQKKWAGRQNIEVPEMLILKEKERFTLQRYGVWR